MQIKVRTRKDGLDVCDENGNIIPGVEYVKMLPWQKGDANTHFEIGLRVAGTAVIDGEAGVEKIESKVEIGDDKQPAAAKSGKTKDEGKGGAQS